MLSKIWIVTLFEIIERSLQSGLQPTHRRMNGIDLGVHNVQRGLDALAVLLQPQKQHLDIAQVGRRPCDKAAVVSPRFGGLT